MSLRSSSPDHDSETAWSRSRSASTEPLCEEERDSCRAYGATDTDAKSRRRGGERRGSEWARGRELLTRWKLRMELENSGSVARDHLASERTFLAYARTSLAMASAGVAFVQLFALSGTILEEDLGKYARPLGAVMVIIGMYTLAVGGVRFFIVQDALIRGVYPVTRVTPTLLSFTLVAVAIVILAIILADGS